MSQYLHFLHNFSIAGLRLILQHAAVCVNDNLLRQIWGMTTGLSADSTIANIYLAQDFDQHVCKSRSLACKGFMRFVDGGAIIKSSFLEIMTLFDFGEARWYLHWFFVQDVVFSWLSMRPHGGYLRRETEFILLVSLSTAVFFLCCVFYFSKYCFVGPSARWIITNKKHMPDSKMQFLRKRMGMSKLEIERPMDGVDDRVPPQWNRDRLTCRRES